MSSTRRLVKLILIASVFSLMLLSCQSPPKAVDVVITPAAATTLAQPTTAVATSAAPTAALTPETTPASAPAVTSSPTPTPVPSTPRPTSTPTAIFRPATFEDVARQLVSKVPIADGARVYGVAVPFPGGSDIIIKPDFGDAIVVRPSQPAYFFLIDDAPTMRFAHPVRYVLLDASGDVRVYPNKWLPTVNGQRWELHERINVEGKEVIILREAVKAPAGSAPSGTPPQPGKTSRTMSWDLFAFARNLLPWRMASAQPGHQRVAIVVDGGEEQGRDYRADVAQQFAKDADEMAARLRQLGYDDTRLYSGYKGNTVSSVDNAGFRNRLTRLANEVHPGAEVTIYLGGHGDKTGFGIYTRQGEADWVEYAELAGWLKAIDTRVSVRLIIDACEAGGAMDKLKDRPNTTIIPAADEKTETPIGIGAELSFSEHVQEGFKGKAEDRNKDGKIDLNEALFYASVQNKSGGEMVNVPPPVIVSAPLQAVRPTPTGIPAPDPCAGILEPVTRSLCIRLGAPPGDPQPPANVPGSVPLPGMSSVISPAGVLTGTWRGGMVAVDFYDPPVCQYTWELTLDLQQAGNDLQGKATAKYLSAKKLQPAALRSCDPLRDWQGNLKGTVSSSAVQFAIGEKAYSGSFTTDLMGGLTQSGPLGEVRECFQVGRSGAIAGCEPTYEKTPLLSVKIDSVSCSIVRRIDDYYVVSAIVASGTAAGGVGARFQVYTHDFHTTPPQQVTIGWTFEKMEDAYIPVYKRDAGQPATTIWSVRFEGKMWYPRSSSLALNHNFIVGVGYISLTSPVVDSKMGFLKAKVSTTIGEFSYTAAGVN